MEPKRRGRPPKLAEPHRQVLTEHELTGLCREAFWAYDRMDEAVRIDSMNRRWVFVPVIRECQSELLLKLQRLNEIREDYISTAILASDQGRDRIEEVVRALDGAIS